MRVRQPRIHVLGLGSIGTFTAHGLREIPGVAPEINLRTLAGTTVSHGGYDVELHRNGQWQTPSSAGTRDEDEIDHLIVTVKATQTNGCGMTDEVNEHLFPNPLTRPNYLVGVISHAVTLASPFNATHRGAASISLGLVPRTTTGQGAKEAGLEEGEAKATTTYMLRALPLSARLSATSHVYTDLLQIQLEKLAVNAFCHPVCALHDAKNAVLFTMPALRRAILSEISTIVLNLPELAGVRGLEERFAVERLEETVNGILERTRETTCSMVVDLRNHRETEVRYMNGYWVRRGRELGVSVAINESLMEQVLERSVPKNQVP
ncbi:ketopantoate reductase PanE/ApbA C terminal-domain-containing protein [Aspergillus desertorum]